MILSWRDAKHRCLMLCGLFFILKPPPCRTRGVECIWWSRNRTNHRAAIPGPQVIDRHADRPANLRCLCHNLTGCMVFLRAADLGDRFHFFNSLERLYSYWQRAEPYDVLQFVTCFFLIAAFYCCGNCIHHTRTFPLLSHLARARG